MKQLQLKKNQPNLKPLFSSFPALFSVLALLLAGSSFAFSVATYTHRPTKVVDNSRNSTNNSVTFSENSVAEVANKVAPSVVSILTQSQTTSFFGSTNSITGSGTGFIISANGYVITNKHVINNAQKISIVRADGTVYDQVKIIGVDPNNDIAFLQIENVNDLPAATLGDSKTVVPGQPVIAIGNALGEFQNTITNGIISGIGRSITATDGSRVNQAENLTDMLQTNASINPGNSGGPLVNAAGEIIGINTAVSTSAQGIGFAIPISSVKGMIKHLTATGKLEKAYLGVYYMNINASVAKAHNLPASVKSGAYIFTTEKYSAIVSGSSADKAGFKDKDIITAINGVPVGTKGSVSTLIGEYAVGEKIDINILRENKEMSLSVELQPFPTH